MKKIVFITSRLPYPANSGRKNVMYNYCKILHEVYKYEVYVASFLEMGDVVEPKPPFIKDVFILRNVGTKKKLTNLFLKTFLTRKYPIQVSLYYDEQIKLELWDFIDEINPEFIMADMVRTTEYIRDYNGFKIADLDDLISIRYKRQIKMNLKYINPYGSYLYSLPEIIQMILSCVPFKKYILKKEIYLLEKYEEDISSCFDKTVFVAQHEADLLNEKMKFDKAVSIPLGVDVEYFGEYYNKLNVEQNTICFLGAMSVAHNESGVIYFIKEVLPLVRDKVQNAKFIIVGGGVTELVRKLAAEDQNIILTGRVKDVRRHVGQSSVFVCPLTFGSGIKTKNLEAMAMGVPVVTTSIGAENINAVNNRDWIVADSSLDFANAIIELLNNKEKASLLRKNANKFVTDNFTWKIAEEKMTQIFPNI